MDFSMNDDGASGIGGAASNNTLHDSLAQSEHDFDVPEIRAPDAKSIVTTSNLNSEDPSVSRNSTAAKLRDDGFTWRTEQLLEKLTGAWEETDGMSLDELVDREMQEKDGRVPKRVAAQTFYEMLVLKSKGMLEVEQEAPFGQISLAPPPTQPTVQ